MIDFQYLRMATDEKRFYLPRKAGRFLRSLENVNWQEVARKLGYKKTGYSWVYMMRDGKRPISLKQLQIVCDECRVTLRQVLITQDINNKGQEIAICGLTLIDN